MWCYACYASLCYQLPIYFQKFPDVSGAPVICAHVPKIAQVLPAKIACASGIYAHICAAYHGVACFMVHGASPEMPVVCCALLRARDLRACVPDYPRLSARQIISTRRMNARPSSCARMSPVDACSLLRGRDVRACAPDYHRLPARPASTRIYARRPLARPSCAHIAHHNIS